MFIKTQHFDEQLKKDIKYITVNNLKPMIIKGSYPKKKNGDIITDIDFESHVCYNDKLLDIITDNITKSNKFIFLQLSCGINKDFEVPWTIGETGDCFFEPNIVIKWFNNIKVSHTTREYIKSKLYSSKLRIRDLIDIENILQPYSDVIWDKYSIKRKFKIINNTKIYLLDSIKSNVSVLEFLYHYEDYYIPIDIALVDENYKTSITERMYKYYTQDYYKILKSYRGKINGYKYMSEYKNVMSKITILISVQYQLSSIITVIKNKSLSIYEINRLMYNLCNILYTYGIICSSNINLIRSQIYDYVNNYLSKYVSYFTNLLLPNHKGKYSLNIKRGIESQIPTDFKTMKSRLDIGVLCPFFPTNMNEFKFLTSLSERLDIHSETLIQCFSTVAIHFNIHVSDVIKQIDTNNLSITTHKRNVTLWDDNKKIKEYDISYKKKLQIHILFNISIEK
jgi:hypothetical protein